MKKLIALLLCCMLVLTGCAGTTVVVGECTCPPGSHDAVETPTEAATEAPVATEAPAVSESAALKTGLAIVPALSGSNATAEENGKVSYDVTVVAVTVDEAGVIASCVIDSVGVDAAFDATGTPAAEGTTEVLSKNEKGFDYGMVKYNASAIGKEWFEQAEALAQFAVGKTMEQVKAGIAGGYASDVDLKTSASIYLGGYVGAMEVAVNNAQELGAAAGEEVKLAVNASLNCAAGKAELTVDAAAVTMDGETITSCVIDSLQAAAEVDATGAITTDLTVAPLTKTQKGFDYGMVKYNASAIGKEWFEQVATFCEYVTGKTAAEVAGIAITETTAPADVDLAAGCSIAIGGFQSLIAEATK